LLGLEEGAAAGVFFNATMGLDLVAMPDGEDMVAAERAPDGEDERAEEDEIALAVV
jgi:hypothetical protein